MEETIKDIEIIAYKGMNSDMTCREFQYELGKTYKTDNVELCNCGFHACLNPIDVMDYYFQQHSRYFKVKLSGKITKCGSLDTKVAATEIAILEEITDIFDEVIETTEWWKNNNILDLLHWSEGFARVKKRNCLWNFIDKQGNTLFNECFEFEHVYDFQEGFAIVEREDGLYNFIDKQGNILSDEWFIDVCDFNDGFAIVQRDVVLWNFIDKKGNYLSKEWFYWVDDFNEGFARVQRKDYLYNFIDGQGNILSDEWFIDADEFNEYYGDVQRTNGEWCKIDKSGKLLES